MLTPEEKLSRSKSKLLLSQPFYGVLLTSTNITANKDIPTAATNGIDIMYNPEFIKNLTDDEVTGVLLHEVNHIILFHCDPKRKGSRDQEGWNIAVDYADNIIISDMGYKLPQEALLDHQYKNLCAEEIYDKLPKNGKGNGPGKAAPGQGGSYVIPNGKGVLDQHNPMPGDSMTKADIAGKIIAAAEATKNKGNLPGGIERWLKELRDSQVDWRQIFQNFIGTVMSKTEYNWYPCNRRFIADGFCLPSLYDKKIGQIVVAFDTSGSIGQRELNQFITELKTIQRFVSEIICISCDAEVHTVVSLSDVDSVKKFVPKGGGGTDFRPVFNYIQKKNVNPEVLIYITDGFGTYPERAPFYPVLWVLTPNHENPPETLGWRVVMNGLKDE